MCPCPVYLKGREPSFSAVRAVIKNYACSVAAITAYELWLRVERAEHSIGEDALLRLFRILPFDNAAARRAAKIHADLLQRGMDIGPKDVFIASIFLEHSLPLLTANVQHFSRVPGLKIIDPEELVRTQQ